MDFSAHYRSAHFYNYNKWNELFKSVIFNNLWPLSILSMLIFTRQYYDMVYRVMVQVLDLGEDWLRFPHHIWRYYCHRLFRLHCLTDMVLRTKFKVFRSELISKLYSLIKYSNILRLWLRCPLLPRICWIPS
jgi:hypothetical protein